MYRKLIMNLKERTDQYGGTRHAVDTDKQLCKSR